MPREACGAWREAADPGRFRRILIVGAGGFGREVLQWFHDAWPGHRGLVAGFLSANPLPPQIAAALPPVIADPDDFEPHPGDGLLMAIGIPGVRRIVAESLSGRSASFLTLVHPSATVASTARVGTGSIICPHAVVSDMAAVGASVLINYHASLGHDASAADYCVLSPYATLGGGARIDEDVFLGLHASVGPNRTIGRGSKVSSNSCALVNVPPGSIVFGVPGCVRPLL